MKRLGKLAATFAGLGCFWMLGVLPVRAGTPALDSVEGEEDGVTIPQGHKEAYEAAKEQMKEAPQEEHRSGTWFLAGFMGMGFPQTDHGYSYLPAVPALGLPNESYPFTLNSNFSFMGGLQGGYYWHDPDKWGNLSFSAEAFGAYLGSSINTTVPGRYFAISGTSLNLGLLGLGGTLGYRIAKSWEPYIGFYGGGVIGNTASDAISGGSVWGYWFAPAVGVRYFIPNSHWYVALQGMFLFINDLNAFTGEFGIVSADLNHNGGYMYAPVALLTVGYAF